MIQYCISIDNQKNLIMTKEIPLSELDKLVIVNNIIENLTNDKSYYFSKNFFEINFIELDNIPKKELIDLKIESLFEKKLKYGRTFFDYVIYDVISNIEENTVEKFTDDILINQLNDRENEIGSIDILESHRSRDSLSYDRKIITNIFDVCKKKEEISQKIEPKEKYNLRMVFIKIPRMNIKSYIFLLYLINLYHNSKILEF